MYEKFYGLRQRPFTLTRYFVWKPENSVHRYECLDRFRPGQ